eukprot:CAMPEP_0172176914 /NCGR_PEP_ID=MMETSP1050-20130122/15118_1 /TAXON_ID=233186 /ORGANISM="Cryptomonas curvata, Strain CCAP979/52" /LENGTH=121 /DNA_ID=CAMNT_0012849321 /DNA_START=442 /DNA_END=804 /DNA_ORIENTATION=+
MPILAADSSLSDGVAAKNSISLLAMGFTLFGEVMDSLDSRYVDVIDKARVERAAAAAAVAAIGDQYSALVQEDQLDGLSRAAAAPASQGSRAATGMAVVLDSRFPDLLTVTGVFDDGPAWR